MITLHVMHRMLYSVPPQKKLKAMPTVTSLPTGIIYNDAKEQAPCPQVPQLQVVSMQSNIVVHCISRYIYYMQDFKCNMSCCLIEGRIVRSTK